MRRYEETHPWMTFSLDLGKEMDHESWMLLGEAVSKMDHIAGVPLHPAVASELNQVYLSKGAHATTQIEGNTLSEDEVRRRLDHDLKLPPSREYLGQEVDNVIEGYNLIIKHLVEDKPIALTPKRIKEFNAIVLRDLPPEEGVTPGEVRTGSVTVGNVYRGAPAGDCEYLLSAMCEWLDAIRATEGPLHRPMAVLAAIMAHLYTAWIHPFGNGNGRTARLIEYQMLIQAGAPSVAAHVLADHYNRTRTEYARQLRLTSAREPYSVKGLIKYALQGLVDGLTQQIDEIRNDQFRVMWVNFIHEEFHDKDTPACSRQRKLVLALSPGEMTPRSKVRELSPALAIAYAGKEEKTVTRDLNTLREMDLIRVRRNTRGTITALRPNIARLRAFMPLVANADGI
ncbi:Fic family protein [Streptomyces sp. PvR006]|uniref:Fic family protein n=1 Tax=Streptomyces sp. PvR006 TaxID=2817860 RepID=UPI001AE54372|nr:Fic family protein [Streptomyces sp. PvR006]MBP2583749.1 Fic family protein [Streptomyces sp. PvR006]